MTSTQVTIGLDFFGAPPAKAGVAVAILRSLRGWLTGNRQAQLATITVMLDHSAPEIQRLREAYAAFNARDIDAAFATMSRDVSWPRAFKGGFVQGQPAIRAYWTEQWSEIDPHVEPVAFYPAEDGAILVEVHQVVRDLSGAILADVHVGHRFTMEHGLIKSMELCPPPPSSRRA